MQTLNMQTKLLKKFTTPQTNDIDCPAIDFDPKKDKLGFNNRIDGFGFDIEENTDYSHNEKLPKGYKRIVSCYDQGKDKWQCVGITQWCLVEN
jgi:hypothetical protein